MSRYRIELELNAPNDETVRRVLDLAEHAAPILERAGVRIVREASRPWVLVDVVEARPAPPRERS